MSHPQVHVPQFPFGYAAPTFDAYPTVPSLPMNHIGMPQVQPDQSTNTLQLLAMLLANTPTATPISMPEPKTPRVTERLADFFD